MTAQIPDCLIHHGRKFDLCDAPLYTYLKCLPKARRPRFRPQTTANWRGYIATWEIIDGRLFLTGISEAAVEKDGEIHDATLETVFPRGPYPKPATWVTGALRCPEGRLRSYAHAGFASVYERDRLFIFEKGVLVEEWLRYNPPAPLHYLINSDGSRSFSGAFTTQALNPEEDPFPGNVPVEPWRVWGDPNWDVWNPDEKSEESQYFIAGYTQLR